jgi:DNA-binding response OmpR family regulator
LRRIKAEVRQSVAHFPDVTLAVSNPSGRAVLALVDDDAPLRAAIAFDLDTAGFEVSAFPDAESAHAADPSHWRCLIVDLNLPGMSGLDLAEQMRSRGHRAPAILITSNPSHNTRVRARAARVAIVEKPLLGGALVCSVRELLAEA